MVPYQQGIVVVSCGSRVSGVVGFVVVGWVVGDRGTLGVSWSVGFNIVSHIIRITIKADMS